MKDMFGREVIVSEFVEPKKRKDPLPRGHIMSPGTGPKGETCGSCEHLFRNQMAKTYLKCELNRVRWTGGRATDVRAKDQACSKWEAIKSNI